MFFQMHKFGPTDQPAASPPLLTAAFAAALCFFSPSISAPFSVICFLSSIICPIFAHDLLSLLPFQKVSKTLPFVLIHTFCSTHGSETVPMSFGLGRAESVTRLSQFEPRPNPSLYRSSSLIDVNRFTRDTDRFTPRSSSFAQHDSSALWSSRIYRPSFVMDNHWFDKFYYFSPIYKGTQPYKCHVASHRLTYPATWHQPYDYWRRVKHFWHDSDNDYAPLYRRMFEPFYGESAHTQRFWHRYRSHLLNNDVYE